MPTRRGRAEALQGRRSGCLRPRLRAFAALAPNRFRRRRRRRRRRCRARLAGQDHRSVRAGLRRRRRRRRRGWRRRRRRPNFRRSEIVDQAGKDAVRAEFAADLVKTDVVLDPAAVEVAVLQADVEMGEHRRTHSADDLPGEVAVLDRGVVGIVLNAVSLAQPGNARAGADIEVERNRSCRDRPWHCP